MAAEAAPVLYELKQKNVQWTLARVHPSLKTPHEIAIS